MTQVFNYSEYETDYITRYLQDHGDEVPDWFKTFVTGDGSVSQNRDDDLEDYLSQTTYVPSIGLTLSAAQPADPSTTITFSAIDFQSTDTITWLNSLPTRLTLIEAGVVVVVGNFNFASSVAGNLRAGQIYLNGFAITGAPGLTLPPIGGGSTTIGSTTVIQSLDAGDYVELFCLQDSGGPINVQGTLSAAYLGRAG